MSNIKELGNRVPPPADHSSRPVDAPSLAQPAPPVDALQAEVKVLLEQSQYDPATLPNTDAAVRGKGLPFQKAVQELVPDLSRLKNLPEVKNRFGSDYQLLREQVIGVPHLDGSDKANRAFEFFSAYASRFVVVATGESDDTHQAKDDTEGQIRADLHAANLWNDGLRTPQVPMVISPPVDPKEATAEAQSFAESLKQLGFAAMRETRSGKNGVELARELLIAPSLEEMKRKLQPPQQMEASGQWPPDPEERHPQPGSLPPGEDFPESHFGTETHGPSVRDLGESPADFKAPTPWQNDASKVVIQAAPRPDSSPRSDKTSREDRTRAKRLGPKMLWNVLHTYRGTGEDSVLAQDEKSKLAWIALFVLGMAAVIVIVLVSL